MSKESAWYGDDGGLLVGGPDIASLGELAQAVPVLSGRDTCETLDRVFRRSPSAACAVVTHPDLRDVAGLVERSRFEAMMVGPYGYGRSLYARRPLVEIVHWDALSLPDATSVVTASSRAITRPADQVTDHVLARGPHGFRVASMPALLAAVAHALAGRALRDPLTGLANRSAFFGRVEESCRRTATRPGHATAVVFFDLDGFKAVNDDEGHDAGDRLLCSVAATLSAAARPTDLVARLGGDEFAVCLDLDAPSGADTDGAPAALALAIAQRLHSAVTGLQQSDTSASRVRVSAGVAACTGGGVEPDELVRAADLAMYRGKRDGGDRIADPVVVTSATGADPLAGTSVAEAIDRDELRLMYQPIVRLEDGSVASVEALVRWQHPARGLLTPDAFLYSAARNGQLVVLDDWVLRTATREFAAWRAVHPAGSAARAVSLNVNVSTDRLLTPGLCGVLVDASARAGLPRELVRVEVPEHLLVTELQAATEPLRQLRAAGFRVDFDDVGAGGTSLRHLREVRADGLKIDRSFVEGMREDPRDRALVQLLVDYGQSTDLAVCAEGVETLEQRDALLAMGCRYAQGWLFARPGPLTGIRVDDDRPVALVSSS